MVTEVNSARGTPPRRRRSHRVSPARTTTTTARRCCWTRRGGHRRAAPTTTAGASRAPPRHRRRRRAITIIWSRSCRTFAAWRATPTSSCSRTTPAERRRRWRTTSTPSQSCGSPRCARPSSARDEGASGREDGSELMVDDDWRRVPVVVAGCRRDARQAHEGRRAGQSNGAAGMNGNGHGNGQSSAAAEVKTAETKLGDETDSTANDGGSSSGDALLALMETWREVESCVECSARTGFNVLKTIALARRASLYPAAPLTKNVPVPGTKALTLGSNRASGSTTTTHGLSRRCVEALSGVFRTHDVDGDGVLTDADVASVQRRSFRVPLAPGELDGLKAVCANGLDGGVVTDLDGNGGSGLTLSGFLYAHGLFVRRGRAETTWTVLRAHGYDDDLEPIEADDEAEEGTAEGEAVRSVEGIAAGRVDLNVPFAVSKKVDVVAYLAAGAVLVGAALLALRMTSGREPVPRRRNSETKQIRRRTTEALHPATLSSR